MSGDRRVDHDSQVDGKQVVMSMERPHRPAVCAEVPLVRTPFVGGSNPRLGPYFRILSFSTAVFCYIQLASSTVVPVVHWDALEKLKVTCSVHLSAILSETNPMTNVIPL